MKRILALLALSSVLYSCASSEASNSTSDSTKADNTTEKSATSGSEKPAEPATKWTYWDKEDKMTSEKKFFASVDANEKLDFDFPYDGGSTATLMIRHEGKEDVVMLSVSKGQFITGIDGGTVTVRFDSKKAVNFATSGPSDGSSDLVFIENSNKFMRTLKGAKKVLIEAEFYEAGPKVMEFNTDGFKWNH